MTTSKAKLTTTTTTQAHPSGGLAPLPPAKRINAAIKRHGFTQKQVADAMGISHIALNYQINGNPRLGTLQRIADAIGADIGELFYDARRED